jgi:GAF domain-containing protein
MPVSTPASLLPPDEAARLRSVRACAILDAPPERVFAELAELSAYVFGLPVALIGIVDAEQVVYKAVHGLPGLCPQARAETFCALVVRENKPVILADVAAARHPYLLPAAELAAQAAGVRFYAGAPLRLSDTHSLGTLCVVGYQPRPFSGQEQHLLEQFAHVVSLAIEARHACLVGEELGAIHWSVVEYQLAEEVRALVALVRYLLTRPRTELAVPLLVLEHVGRRLGDVREMLADYQPRRTSGSC